MGHVISYYIDGGLVETGEAFLWLRTLVYSFHVPLFYIVSGYVFGKAYLLPDQRVRTEKVKVQLANLGIVYLVWSILFIVLVEGFSYSSGGAVQFSLSNALVLKILYLPVKANNVFWFLLALIGFCLFTLVIWNRKSATVILLLGIYSVLSAFELYSLGYYYLFFAFGLYVQQDQRVLDWLVKPSFILLNLAVGAGLLVVGPILTETGWNIEWAVKAVKPFALSAGLMGLFRRLSCVTHFPVLALFGRYSMEIYVMHCFVMPAARILMSWLGLIHSWSAIIITFALASAVPVAVSATLRKIGLRDLAFRPAT